MTQKNIAAFTANASPYPPYLSINEQPTGNVTITVRSPATGEREGAIAHVELWPEQWAEIKRQIREFDA